MGQDGVRHLDQGASVGLNDVVRRGLISGLALAQHLFDFVRERLGAG